MAAIGIFGGRFDPVHRAHLSIAKAAADALALAEVRWIVTGRPEHKGTSASAQHRLEMVRLALDDLHDPRMILDDREIRAAQAGHSNYTADTVMELQKEFPGQPLVLIIGEDQLQDFGTWSRWEWLVQHVKLAVYARPDSESGRTAQAIEKAGGHILWINAAPDALSSTAIRQGLASTKPEAAIRGLIPDSVARYIETHHLYTSTS